MAEPVAQPSALLLLAAFSRYPTALAWTRDRVAQAWGPIALESETFAFDQTEYYRPTMGRDLAKVFYAIAEPVDPGSLPDLKLLTGQWEREYAATGRHCELRPLNLDPGYLTLGKLVLASTKDFAHRIYLRKGIYAEITLYFRHGRWQDHQWTFPDYRREDYQRFFSECRDYLHELARKSRQTTPPTGTEKSPHQTP
jgi:hypothetical protein